MDINISLMTKDDLPEVLRLEKESFSWPWSRKMFQDEMDRDFSFIQLARDGSGQFLGFICFWLLQGEEHILNIAVREAARRKGVGTRLAMGALRFAYDRGVNSATLEVREKNIAAIGFYERLGFVRAGRRKGYYESPRDNAVIMWLYDIREAIEKTP